MEHLQHISAWFPSSPAIAGVRLLPLTLGHWRLLEAMGLPFTGRTERAPSVDDVRAALLVCSIGWRRAYRLVRHPTLFAIYASIKCRRATVQDAIALQAYFSESWFKPERFVEDTDGASAKSAAYAPCCGAAIRVAMAAERAGVKRLARRLTPCIWDVTIAEALWIISCSEELSGAELESAEDVVKLPISNIQ